MTPHHATSPTSLSERPVRLALGVLLVLDEEPGVLWLSESGGGLTRLTVQVRQAPLQAELPGSALPLTCVTLHDDLTSLSLSCLIYKNRIMISTYWVLDCLRFI